MAQSQIDRRIIRSKTLLKNALRELMAQKKFSYITVLELSDLSTVNRATFYKHYIDKHALLEEVFQEDFRTLLEKRTHEINGIDRKFLRQIILAVCDFLLPMQRAFIDEHNTFVPMVQKTVQQLTLQRLLRVIEAGSEKGADLLEVRLKASMASWSIYAAVSEWIELLLEKKIKRKDMDVDDLLEKILDPIAGLIK